MSLGRKSINPDRSMSDWKMPTQWNREDSVVEAVFEAAHTTLVPVDGRTPDLAEEVLVMY